MFALYVLVRPWTWLWVPRMRLRIWLCVGFVTLALCYMPVAVLAFWVILYTVYVYVHTVNRAKALMGEF